MTVSQPVRRERDDEDKKEETEASLCTVDPLDWGFDSLAKSHDEMHAL